LAGLYHENTIPRLSAHLGEKPVGCGHFPVGSIRVTMPWQRLLLVLDERPTRLTFCMYVFGFCEWEPEE
jgi:hypothetical protein